MGAGDLRKALEWLPEEKSAELLVGFETKDDAAVVRLGNGKLLLLTVDFFPPVVDTPYLFGQIAAANSLSDIYAMGGQPIVALNLVSFPCNLGMSILGEILQGGNDKVREAGAFLAGGHTVQDDEPKYGLSVTGTVDEKALLTNATAQIGDRLVLTKPLGLGVLTTALKAGFVSEDDIGPALQEAAKLNKAASEAARKVGVSACTDVTGFGLLGHLHEMLTASGVSARIEATDVPIWEDALDLADQGMVPGGSRSNRMFLEGFIKQGKQAPMEILFDPQTSGGLLISVPEEKAADLLKEMESAGVETRAVIGEITEGDAGMVEVV